MRKGWVLVVGGFIGVFGLVAMTAEKPSEQYSKAMRDMSAAAQGLNSAIPAEDFEAVSKNAVSIIEALPVVTTYWVGKGEDAVKWTHTAEKAAADLRVAAGQKSSEGVAYAAKELTDTCMQCHTAHRDKLSDGSFQIK